MENRVSVEPVALSWRIKDRPGHTLVQLQGEIDENADFSELRRRLRGAVVLELGEVRRINSCGVREWVNFVRELGATKEVTDVVFTHCSPAIVTQLNMIYNFRGQARVRSFLAPYVCQECDHETEKLLDVQTHFPGRTRVPPDFTCEKCAGRLELDDVPERYLSFLNDS
jgi:anti-anti-sigma regulatory factor